MGVTRFEDLVAWQKARSLAGSVYRMTKQSTVARDFGFASQIQRAAVSSMSNVAEGFERGTPKEFQRFLATAKGSAAEVRSLLHLASDIGYIDQTLFNALLSQTEEVSRVIGGLRAAVQRRIVVADRRPVLRARRHSPQHSAPSTQNSANP